MELPACVVAARENEIDFVRKTSERLVTLYLFGATRDLFDATHLKN